MCDFHSERVGNQWQQQIDNKSVVEYYMSIERFCLMMPY